MFFIKKFILFFCLTIFCRHSFAQDIPTRIDPTPFNDNTRHWYGISDKHNIINALPGHPQYKPEQIKEIADNILLFQKTNGGWPKNYDMFAILTPEQHATLIAAKNDINTTFDNGTTFTQIKALAIAYANLQQEKYKQGALNGLKYIITSQYSNGGWPQYYPLQNNYSRQVTYNDGNFEGIMRLLKDVNDKKPLYNFIPSNMYTTLANAYNKGIDCILKTQIFDGGILTAWCQQYDEKTLQPAWARKFEPAAISNGESAGIVLFLMSIKHPDNAIIKAVEGAIHWFEVSKIYNTRVETVKVPKMQTTYRTSTTDKVVTTDSTAMPIWTRYYELKTHRPMFCNRDSKIVYTLAEVERERRDGYAWYTYDPQKALDKYIAWKSKWIK